MHKVAQQYFSILEDYFGDCFELAKKGNFKRNNYWKKINEVYDPITALSFMDSLYEDLSKLDWTSQESNIQRMGGLQVAYLGSIYSYLQNVSNTNQFIKKSSLYADSIIVPDMVFSELWAWNKKGRTGFEISFPIICFHAIDALFLKSLYFSDTDIPVCTLSPPLMWKFEKENKQDVADKALFETELDVAEEFFGQKFSSQEDLQRFLSTIKSPEEFFSRAKKRDILQIPNGHPVTIHSYEIIKKYYETKYVRKFESVEIYESMLRSNLSMVSYDLTYHANNNVVLSTDFKGVWNTLNWLMKYSRQPYSKILQKKAYSKEALILRGLQEDDIKWIGKIPIEKIAEVRARGELQDLRDILAVNIKTIEEASDDEFMEVGLQVKHNIETALKKHSASIKDLDDYYKRKYQIKVPSLVVSGALGISAFFCPPIAILAGILGGNSVKDLIEEYQEKRSKMKELQKKPVAMLFDAYENHKSRQENRITGNRIGIPHQE